MTLIDMQITCLLSRRPWLICKLPNNYSQDRDYYAIDLIAMQIMSVSDSLATLTLLFRLANCLAPIGVLTQIN